MTQLTPVPYNDTPDFYRLVGSAVNNLIQRKREVSSKSAAYTITVGDDVVLVDATTGAITVTLPKAGPYVGISFTVKKIDASANAVTVDGDGAETIDGAANTPLAAQWDRVTVVSNGTAWFKV